MEELAIIEQVGVGQRDCSSPVLWFSVVGDGWGALQVFPLAGKKAIEILRAVYEVRELNGRACVVNRGDGPGSTVTFERLLPAAKQ